MKKFKEILFLKNLNRVGKKSIFGKYWNILNESNDLDDLILKIKNVNAKFSDDEYLQSVKDKVNKIYDEVITSDIHVITIFDDNYPEKLKIMENEKPLILYIKGEVEILEKPNISFIGTRNPSHSSEFFENKIIKAILDTSERVIVSGLALGCDKIAHQTTVDENKPTIAVLPSGVNIIKPAKHKKLAEDIIKTGGCLVSEYEPNKTPYKQEYIDRDKIVAAISDAIFVVECGVKSGTMHTVKFADNYQKPVFSYLPDERDEDSYDGNRFILNDFKNSFKVDDVEGFITNLNQVNTSKKSKFPNDFQTKLV
ncbi:MAG: DNA-processing protein DprA [Methanobrevibacter sp.]|nr:DNA-processing protein DprA [Methanobrevibacter sp.]MEE0943341.1 DNA-processing protein DprA [Methanobrevibacter sp.]